METKQCSACKKTLPVNNFSLSGKSANNYRGVNTAVRYASRCKPCASEYARQWRNANPDYERKRKGAKSDTEKQRISFIKVKLQDAKERARKRNKPYDLDYAFMSSILHDKCAISGLPICRVKGSLDVASIDCIDPELGYIKGNVQWVSWRINRAKGEQSTNEFILMCKAVLEGATTIP